MLVEEEDVPVRVEGGGEAAVEEGKVVHLVISSTSYTYCCNHKHQRLRFSSDTITKQLLLATRVPIIMHLVIVVAGVRVTWIPHLQGLVNDLLVLHMLRTRLELAGANAACMMPRLFSHTADAGTDNPSGDDDDGDDEEEPAAANVLPVAAGQGQEPVKYATNRLTAVGRDWLLKKCVKENVFPRIKFANLDVELAFSNDSESICSFMAEKKKVQDKNVERWWMGAKKAVHKKLKQIETMSSRQSKLDFKVSQMVADWLW